MELEKKVKIKQYHLPTYQQLRLSKEIQSMIALSLIHLDPIKISRTATKL